MPKAPKGKKRTAPYGDIISPKRFLIAVVSLCHSKGIVPYEFDKLFWLVDSGKFIPAQGQLTKSPANRKEFMALRREYLATQAAIQKNKLIIKAG